MTGQKRDQFKNDQIDPAYLGYDRSYDRNMVIVQATGRHHQNICLALFVK